MPKKSVWSKFNGVTVNIDRTWHGIYGKCKGKGKGKGKVNIEVNQMAHEIMAHNGAYNNGMVHEGTKHTPMEYLSYFFTH